MPQPPLDPTDYSIQRAVRIPSRLDDELRRRAEIEDRTIAEVWRDALRRYLEDVNTAA